MTYSYFYYLKLLLKQISILMPNGIRDEFESRKNMLNVLKNELITHSLHITQWRKYQAK